MVAVRSRACRCAVLLFGVLVASCGDDIDSHSGRGQRVAKLSGAELVPRELVAALLPTYAGSDAPAPEIIVGGLPDNMPFEVPRPANARVVGALSHGRFGTLILAVTQRPLDAMKAYRELLRSTGWADPGRERGAGFQPGAVVHSGTFCQGDERSITTTAAERSGEETFLQVRYAEARGGHSSCSDRRIESLGPHRGPMPTLYPPPNSSMVDGGGVSGNRHFMEASARLKTDLKPAELVAHYGAELRASGWIPRSEPSGSEIVAQNWRIEDRRGTRWIGLLVAVSIPDSEDREVIFRVMSSEPSRRPE